MSKQTRASDEEIRQMIVKEFGEDKFSRHLLMHRNKGDIEIKKDEDGEVVYRLTQQGLAIVEAGECIMLRMMVEFQLHELNAN